MYFNSTSKSIGPHYTRQALQTYAAYKPARQDEVDLAYHRLDLL